MLGPAAGSIRPPHEVVQGEVIEPALRFTLQVCLKLVMASTLEAMTSNLIAMASNLHSEGEANLRNS